MEAPKTIDISIITASFQVSWDIVIMSDDDLTAANALEPLARMFGSSSVHHFLLTIVEDELEVGIKISDKFGIEYTMSFNAFDYFVQSVRYNEERQHFMDLIGSNLDRFLAMQRGEEIGQAS